MVMAKDFQVGRVEPEFYFHFKLRRRLSENELPELEAALRKIARSAFRQAYPEVDLQFEIELETGSVRGWIRTSGKTVAGFLVATAAFLSQYGSIKSGAQALWEDVTWVLETVEENVEQHISSEYGIREHIHTERRIGAIARLDELITARQNGQMGEEEYLAEATAVLAKIQESEDSKELISALVTYINARYGDELWRGLIRDIADVSRGTTERGLPKREQSPHGPRRETPDDKRRRRRSH